MYNIYYICGYVYIYYIYSYVCVIFTIFANFISRGKTSLFIISPTRPLLIEAMRLICTKSDLNKPAPQLATNRQVLNIFLMATFSYTTSG